MLCSLAAVVFSPGFWTHPGWRSSSRGSMFWSRLHVQLTASPPVKWNLRSTRTGSRRNDPRPVSSRYSPGTIAWTWTGTSSSLAKLALSLCGRAEAWRRLTASSSCSGRCPGGAGLTVTPWPWWGRCTRPAGRWSCSGAAAPWSGSTSCPGSCRARGWPAGMETGPSSTVRTHRRRGWAVLSVCGTTHCLGSCYCQRMKKRNIFNALQTKSINVTCAQLWKTRTLNIKVHKYKTLR